MKFQFVISPEIHAAAPAYEGAAVYARDRKLCFMTACITIGLVFFLPLSSLYPLMTSDYFQGTAWQGSLVELL